MKLTEEQETYYSLKYGYGINRLNSIANISNDLIEFDKNIKACNELQNTIKKGVC